ncbi:MAG: response regulator [Desulfobacteraceae bacterium]|nr:MAG: response regulator [Desulfobacteraceae bacterium]
MHQSIGEALFVSPPKTEKCIFPKTKLKISKKRILVVDDDLNVRELLVKMLTLNHFEVFNADNAYKALRLLSEMSFDIMLTDLEMPGMDGWQLAERAQKQAKKTFIILMTGSNEQVVREKLSSSKVNAVIFKPFGMKELQKVIDGNSGG